MWVKLNALNLIVYVRSVVQLLHRWSFTRILPDYWGTFCVVSLSNVHYSSVPAAGLKQGQAQSQQVVPIPLQCLPRAPNFIDYLYIVRFTLVIILAIRCAATDGQRPLWIANQGIDSVGAGARNGFTYGFTASNAQVLHQIWKVSQRNYSHTFNSSLPVSFYRKCPLEFKDY